MATLEQAEKILSIFRGIPTEQVQAILASGLLADLRDGNIVEVKRDEFRRLLGFKTEPTLSRDMRKEGWTLLEHGPRRINSMEGLKLVPVLKSGEDCIDGEEMVRRARLDLDANYGQEDAEWLLDHQDLIPKEWRQFYIAFPKTVWQGESGDRDVPFLYRDGGQWSLDFFWLGRDWGSSDRLLSFSK